MLPIIAIIGPTAVGKTKLSIELAKVLNGEIINVDSMQVYKDLTIGTAKITKEEQEDIVHHLFDFVEVEELYTVYQYQTDARKKIDEIRSRGHTPIFVGGTGLYLKAALYQYEFNDEDLPSTGNELTDRQLYDFITEKTSTDIHINNRKRLIRQYNKLKSGNEISNTGDKLLYPSLFIGLTAPRAELYAHIDERVHKMIEQGLLEEVKPFYDRKIFPKSIQTGIGYKELYSYFDGNLTLEEVVALIQKNSRHYAKRQYTYFNHQLPVRWFESNYENFEETIEEVLTYIKNNEKKK